MATIDKLTIGVDFKRCDKCEYKHDASFRDNLLITAGARAAYMDGTYVSLPSGVEGEADSSEKTTMMMEPHGHTIWTAQPHMVVT